MAYTPKNISVYSAAFAGMLSGISGDNRWPESTTATEYAALTAACDAFAQAFDTAWGSNPDNTYQQQAISGLCAASWANRTAKSTTPADYTVHANALIAIIAEGSTQIASEGITPIDGLGIISVATTADLAAQPPVAAPQGLLASVQASGGSYWSWYPTGSTPPAGAVTEPGVGGGLWSLGVSVPQQGTAHAANPTRVLTCQPADTTVVPFQLNLVSALFSATWDNLATFGWNADATVNGPISRLNFEQDYEVAPGVHWFETYFEFHSDNTNAPTTFYRPVYANFDKTAKTGATILTHGFGNFAGNYIALLNAEGTIAYFQGGPAASGGVQMGVASLPLTIGGGTTQLTTGTTTWNAGTFDLVSSGNAYFDAVATLWRSANGVTTFGRINASALLLAVPLGGYGVPLQEQVWATPIDVSAGHALSATEAENACLILTGNVAGPQALTVPNTVGAVWDVDLRGVTLGAALSFTTGAGTPAAVTAAQLAATGANGVRIVVTAANVVSRMS